MMAKRFWYNIQLVRLVAAFGIVAIHLRRVLKHVGISESSVDIFRLGTDSFLVVSAFLSCYIMTTRSRPPLEYLRGRVIRIVPAYWVLTIFFVFLKYILMSSDSHDSVSRIIYSLAFLPYEDSPIIYPAWSLSLILEFAFIVSLSFLISRRRGIELTILFSSLMAGIGYTSASNFELVELYCDPRMLNFAAGATIVLLVRSTDNLALFDKYRQPLSVLCFIMIILAFLISGYWAYGPHDLSRRLLLVSSTIMIVSVAILDKLDIYFESKWIDRLCNLSFMIYLTHFMWIIMLEKLMTIVPTFATISLIIVTPLICISLAWVFYNFLEMPIVEFFDRLTKRWLERLATPVLRSPRYKV